MTATSTLELSTAIVAGQFANACAEAAAIATAVFRVVYGIDDGNDYGRYFAGQNPLIPYQPSATSLSSLMAQGLTLRQAVGTAAAALAAAAIEDDATFATAADTLIEALRQACANPSDAVLLLAQLATFSPPVQAGTAGDGIDCEIAQLATNAAILLRRTAAIGMGMAIADYVPSSQQDAAALQQSASDLLDDVAEEASDQFDDESAGGVNALRLAISAGLVQLGGSLSPIKTVNLPAPLPAAVIAYRLYGDAMRADDLVARNDPPDPSFMPVTIEALAA